MVSLLSCDVSIGIFFSIVSAPDPINKPLNWPISLIELEHELDGMEIMAFSNHNMNFAAQSVKD